jgi:DsbC/DsbD-like thiol-disulfide interchange protein
MIMPRRLVALIASLAAVFSASPGDAADRAKALGGELRLLTGFAAGGAVQAGLGILLEPGWKTYWRSPGDGGIPPQIDTSESQNVAAVEIAYPAPIRFEDGVGWSVGYKADVVLPITVRLADPSRPGRLVLKVLVGICKDICVPVDAVLVAPLDPKATPQPAAIAALAAARSRLPAPVAEGADFAVASLRREEKALIVTLRVPDPAAPHDLFAEGPDGWGLPVATRIGEKDGTTLWRVPLEGLPKGTDPKGAELRFTLTQGRRAVEQRLVID